MARACSSLANFDASRPVRRISTHGPESRDRWSRQRAQRSTPIGQAKYFSDLVLDAPSGIFVKQHRPAEELISKCCNEILPFRHDQMKISRPTTCLPFLLMLTLSGVAIAAPETLTKDVDAASHRAQPRFRGVEVQRQVTGKNLLVPITNRKGSGHLAVIVDDQLVHNLDCNFTPSKDAVSWWAYLDMSEYVGKTATLHVEAPNDIAELIKFGDELPNLLPLYNESLRPQFHFSQKRGWNNDPNGLVYYDGEYHFCWQSNPAGNQWANMYWGHAVSADMVHWTELPHALRCYGDNVEDRYPSMAVRNCFSGSANVDTQNTAGWKTGDEDVLVAAFTDTGCGEALAYSNDRGRTWTYYEQNPIIRHDGRDPKLIWYSYDQHDVPISDAAKKLGGHWVIAVYDQQDGSNGIAFYNSTNLKEWTKTSWLPDFFECPELFQLPVDGDQNNKKWVTFSGDAKYVIGDFDGKTFTPEHKGKCQLHYGAFYASQCFNNLPDGRVVQVGWAKVDMPGMPFNQGFTLPLDLTLRTTPQGVRMFANPIKGIESLRRANPIQVQDRALTDENSIIKLGVDFSLADIVLKVKRGTAKQVVLQVGNFSTTYDFDRQQLDGNPAPLEGDVANIRMLIDRPLHEIIGGDGACYITQADGSEGKLLGNVTVATEGGSARIESLEIYELRSIWKR